MPVHSGEDENIPSGPVDRDELDASRVARREKRKDINFLANVVVDISANLGSTTMKVRDVLELKKGSVLTLDRAAGEMADIFINGVFLARAEIVAMADTFALRLSDFVRSDQEKFGQDTEDE